MACPTYTSGAALSMLKVARERRFNNYNSSSNINGPIFMSDIQRLSGGNSSGSGENYPAINMLNIQSASPVRNARPDGSNPLEMSEFYNYDQSLQRYQVRFAYSSSSSSIACGLLASSTIYWHTGSNLLPASGDKIYTTETGFTPAPAGYYHLFDPGTLISEFKYAEVIGGGGGFAGTVIDVDFC